MSANGPSLDRWTPDIWRNHVETANEMHQLGWKVFSRCRTCALEIDTDLEALARLKGRTFSLWNKTPRCRKKGCTGRREFMAKPPGQARTFALIATGPGRPARLRQAVGWQ